MAGRDRKGNIREPLEQMAPKTGLAALRERSAATDDTSFLEAVARPESSWRLAGLAGLREVDPDAAATCAERLLEQGVEDPFLLATCHLIQARVGRGDPDDLAARADGRRGLVWEGTWPPRPQLAKRSGGGWPIRRLAVQALACFPEVDGVLARVALEDPDWAVRLAAAEALGQRTGATARRALAECGDDRRMAVRRAAVAALEGGSAVLPDEQTAWRVPGAEPYFRYFGGSARREYLEEMQIGTRNGPGRNWGTFGVFIDLDLGEEPPRDVSPRWPAVQLALRGVPDAVTRARDLVHHPGVAWGDEPHWPTCCGDYTVFYGHHVAEAAPASEEVEDWFRESLLEDLPPPEAALEDFDAELYAFRCGFCGRWWTVYDSPF